MSTEYDVALSYAAEDRSVARKIAEELRRNKIRVFFSEDSSSELWGRDLYDYLNKIYTETKLCLVLYSKHYYEKQWTNLEWRNLKAQSASRSSFAILPVRIDQSEVPEDLANYQYLTWQPGSSAKLTKRVKDLLDTLEPAKPSSQAENYHVIKRENGWSVKREGTSRAASIHSTQREAIETARKLARRASVSSVIVHSEDGSIKSHEQFP